MVHFEIESEKTDWFPPVVHSTARPYGSSTDHVQSTVQFAVLGSNEAPEPAGMELGFAIVAHRWARGLFPGRPEGENVDSLVTSHGFRSALGC